MPQPSGPSWKQEDTLRQMKKNITEKKTFEAVAGKQKIPQLDVIQ